VTPRDTVLVKYPDAHAKCVQPEIHAPESRDRQLHWEVYAGPQEDAHTLGVGLTEESAWTAALFRMPSD